MGINPDKLEVNKTRVQTKIKLLTLDTQDVPPETPLLYTGREVGWPEPAYGFQVLRHITADDYVDEEFARSDEYTKVTENTPHNSDDAEEWGEFHRDMLKARTQLTERLAAETENKPFIEILEQLIILSEYQLQHLTPADQDEDTFIVHR